VAWERPDQFRKVISCIGSFNPNRDWHIQNEAMLAALTEKGYDVTHVFAEGTHSDAHGGSIMPDKLRWLWRDYPK
jgi:hypothetical protein